MSTNRKIYELISSISNWDQFFAETNTLTKQEKGVLFEKLTELVFKTKSIYRSKYKNVWLLREGIDPKLKKKINLPNADEGIDLIAETRTGSYCAIQCKFKGANESPTRKDIATFLDLSRNHCKNISEQILVHTGTNGIKKKSLLPDSFTQVGLDFWSTLNDEDWKAVQNKLKNKADRPSKRNPRKHQIEAIDASIKHFVKAGNKRGKLIMPCGTGKSLTAYWIAESLKSKSTIVAVPSLALIKQSLEDWTKEILLTKSSNLPDWICICSDETTGKITDDFIIDTYSLGVTTTTDKTKIESFLKTKSDGGKVIFTTYQSAEKLAEVSKKIKYKFDLAIFDEAHKTVGNTEKSFSTLLKDSAIEIDKRIFMTATERVVRGTAEDIISMDDTSVYGSVFYQLSFKKAIEQNIITDYKIITVLVNDNEVKGLIANNKYLSDRKRKIDQAESQMLTTALALKKAIKEYDIRHTVSFHKSIAAAKEFQSLYQNIETGKKRSEVYHISSKLNSGDRFKLLRDFKNSDKAIITNARCLTEGVDVPAIDCVLFADEKNSVVDIVQASGRALRQFTNTKTGEIKETGYIIIPLVLNSEESLDDLITSIRFKTVRRIVTSLSTQDETIIEELKIKESGKIQKSSDKIIFLSSTNSPLTIDFDNFSSQIKLKLWEKVSKVNFRSYSDCKLFVNSLNLKSAKDWFHFSSSGNRPFDVPAKPYNTFKNEWKGWNDWLGTNNHSLKSIGKSQFSYAEAKLFLQLNCKGKIESMSIYNKWKNGKLSIDGLPCFPQKMPRNPKNKYTYSGHWVDSFDFFGKQKPKHLKKGIRYDFSLPKAPYEKLKIFLRNKNLETAINYRKWLRKVGGNKVLKGYYVPSKPDIIYGDQFEGWPIFLNSKNPMSIAKSGGINFLTYEKARKFVVKLKLKTWKQWDLYKNGKLKGRPILPINIPRYPNEYYKGKGWVSIAHWLGN